jgi:hypothetical protein
MGEGRNDWLYEAVLDEAAMVVKTQRNGSLSIASAEFSQKQATSSAV